MCGDGCITRKEFRQAVIETFDSLAPFCVHEREGTRVKRAVPDLLKDNAPHIGTAKPDNQIVQVRKTGTR